MRRLLAGLAASLTLAAPPAFGAPLPDLDRLQALVRLQSVNPPGGEEPAAKLVQSWLQAEGIPAHLYETAPGRACVVARLQAGAKPDPTHALMLLGHLDVVPVEAARWHHPPFAAELADGKLYGRGTLDMLSLVVMNLHAFTKLAHASQPLKRDVIFCAVCDEEAGGHQGAGWLLEHHPEEVQCAELINEGGSGLEVDGGRAVMGIQVAERGTYWVRVTAHGETGHGAQDRPNSAPRRLLRALARVEARPKQYEVIPEVGAMLHAMAAAYGGGMGLLLNALATPGITGLLAPTAVTRQPILGPLFGTTVNPDVINFGQKVNVIPSTASAELDIRMLPGHTIAETRAWLRGLLADDTLTITELSTAEPTRNDTKGRIFKRLVDAAREVYPGIQVSEILTPGGGTDSAYFRRYGVRCYGCLPIVGTSAQISSIHGDDEFITPEQLDKGEQVVERTIMRAATED